MAREPEWLIAARRKVGTREAPGAANAPAILGWARKLGIRVLGIVYNADSVPWCGVFVARCFTESGIDLAEQGMHRMTVAVRAKAWAEWGQGLRPARLAPGAVLVFERPGGGHVGFYVGEDAVAYHVLGGNQGDRVSIARIEKSRCIARRWPTGRRVIGKPMRLKATPNLPLSRNEA